MRLVKPGAARNGIFTWRRVHASNQVNACILSIMARCVVTRHWSALIGLVKNNVTMVWFDTATRSLFPLTPIFQAFAAFVIAGGITTRNNHFQIGANLERRCLTETSCANG